MLCEAVDVRGGWRKLVWVRGSRDQESHREADDESRQGNERGGEGGKAAVRVMGRQLLQPSPPLVGISNGSVAISDQPGEMRPIETRKRARKT